MENAKILKIFICSVVGVLGTGITYLCGEWSNAMQTLVILMVIDYLTGLMVAGLFQNSSKTKSGGLKSSIGFKGLCKKFVMLLIVAAMYRVEIMLDIHGLRDLAVIGFAANELISITENAGLMGVPLPPVVNKAIAILNESSNEEVEGE